MKKEHISVLPKEVLDLFADRQLDTFVDGTLGAAGHAEILLEAHPEINSFIGIDQDPDALQMARERLSGYGDKVLYLRNNFDKAIPELIAKGVKVDGILLDLGVSSMQLDRPERGFSFMRDGPLDMRMDRHSRPSASEIVNTWDEHDLGRIFRDYGEEKQWRAAARVIVQAREEKEIKTTRDLSAILEQVLKRKPGKKINPLTLVFQALRIAVNRELEVIEKTIPLCIQLLNTGGRLAVITFHSLEDRIVKQLFKYNASDKESTSGYCGVFLDKDPVVVEITRKPIQATEQEINENPRSSSAKLRCIEKL